MTSMRAIPLHNKTPAGDLKANLLSICAGIVQNGALNRLQHKLFCMIPVPKASTAS